MEYKEEYGPNVAVIGASINRDMISNKAIRALLISGYNVYPVNPIITDEFIEGQRRFNNLRSIEFKIDFVLVYLNSQSFLKNRIYEEIKDIGIRGVILNPGSSSSELLKRLYNDEGVHIIEECSINALGMDPNEL